MTEEQALLILGVGSDASLDEIRSAHRRVMRSVHPDTNDTDEAHRLALLANQAREVLDRAKRAAPTERSSRNGARGFGEADYVEPNYGETDYYAAADDFNDPRLGAAARAYVPEATCAIIEYLEKTPGNTLTADEAGHVALAALEHAGIGPRVRQMVFVAIAARESGLAIFLTLWTIGSYALAGTVARRRQNRRNEDGP